MCNCQGRRPRPPGPVGPVEQSPGWRLPTARCARWAGSCCGCSSGVSGARRPRALWTQKAKGPREVGSRGPPVREGRGAGTGPSAGAALLRSGAVQVPAAARGRRPAPQRASVSRPEGAPDPPPSHQASACLRRRSPRLRSPKRCSRGPAPPSGPSRPLRDAAPVQSPPGRSLQTLDPSTWRGPPLPHSPPSSVVIVLACPCPLLQLLAKVGRGNEAISAGVVEEARLLCDAGARQRARAGPPWAGGPLLHAAA